MVTTLIYAIQKKKKATFRMCVNTLYYFQAENKKQKYEKICEKKMSVSVENLCKVNYNEY